MGEWAKPNNFSAAFRLTSSKYADAFVDTGSIKFNTPQSWIDYSKKYGDGRGSCPGCSNGPCGTPHHSPRR
ncbi:hypothetical protein D3C74_99540 [compost metagenome]